MSRRRLAFASIAVVTVLCLVGVSVLAVAAGGSALAYEVNGTRSFDLSVNGGAAITVSCTGTDFNTPATTTVTVPLNAGSNTIKFSNTSAYAPDLDAVTIR